MDTPGSLKEAIIAYNNYKDINARNRVYMAHIHNFFTATINGAFFSLGIFPDNLGVDKHKDLTQDMYYTLLQYISKIDSQTDIRDVKGYCFIIVRNRALSYLRLHNIEINFKYTCQKAATLINNKTTTNG